MSEHVFDYEEWAKKDIFYQMGNIGSEVGRALTAKRQGKTSRMYGAFYRGIDLINATIVAWAQKNDGRYKELLRARELFAQSILTDLEDPSIEKYFMDFAMAARRNL